MTYLLDTMVVSFFLQVGRESELTAAATRFPMAVVDEVRRELENDHKRGHTFRKWFASSGIRPCSIEVGSAASGTFAQLLHPAAPDKDRGERASVALAAFDSSLIFVTHDRGAAWLALRELWAPGERVLGLAAFLRRLCEQAAPVDAAALDEVMAIACLPAQRPTWWASWRARANTAGSSEQPTAAPDTKR